MHPSTGVAGHRVPADARRPSGTRGRRAGTSGCPPSGSGATPGRRLADASGLDAERLRGRAAARHRDGVALVAVGGSAGGELAAVQRPRPGAAPRRGAPAIGRGGRRALVPDLGRRRPARPLGAHRSPRRVTVGHDDLKVALGLLDVRHVAGDADLADRLRAGDAGRLAADRRRRLLPSSRDLRRERGAPRRAGLPARARPQGGRGGLRDGGPARRRRRLARRRARTPSSSARVRPCSTSATPCTGHRPAARPAGPPGAATGRRRCSACPTPTRCCARSPAGRRARPTHSTTTWRRVDAALRAAAARRGTGRPCAGEPLADGRGRAGRRGGARPRRATGRPTPACSLRAAAAAAARPSCRSRRHTLERLAA